MPERWLCWWLQKATHPLVERLLCIDPPPRHAGHDAASDDNQLNIMSSIFSLCDMELHDVITWAKSIPGECRCMTSSRGPSQYQVSVAA